MTNSLKSYEKFFEKLEDSNFENETTRSEKEYESTREVENRKKMRNLKGLSSIVDKFRIVR